MFPLQRPYIRASEKNANDLVLGPTERDGQQLPQEVDMLPSGGGCDTPVKTVTYNRLFLAFLAASEKGRVLPST